MKKQMKKLKIAKETLHTLNNSGESLRTIVGGLRSPNDKSVYWSCVPSDSGMYTCAC